MITYRQKLYVREVPIVKKLPTRRQNACGENVRLARKNYGKRHRVRMTQADLAAKLQLKGLENFERITVCRIEKGTRQVSDIELKYLAVALEVSAEYLLYGEEGALPTFDTIESIVAETE